MHLSTHTLRVKVVKHLSNDIIAGTELYGNDPKSIDGTWRELFDDEAD
jgi:hypothetical protein